ncbi:hypothetical protein KOW79_016552 [Hemibagrus wyckioides]|uniref:Uncharacterized protein n=1 Tax=Hemibagrus wyckioides TaxID=337641 RepID=A0A9D3NDB9_9TELE|nr:hypothetical protein KOW79_016552 [Hemibagrus wyckioides]
MENHAETAEPTQSVTPTHTVHTMGSSSGALDAHAELPFPRERDSMLSSKTPRPGHLAPAGRLLLPVRSVFQRFNRKTGPGLS